MSNPPPAGPPPFTASAYTTNAAPAATNPAPGKKAHDAEPVKLRGLDPEVLKNISDSDWLSQMLQGLSRMGLELHVQLDALAEQLGVTAAALKKQIERYNKLHPEEEPFIKITTAAKVFDAVLIMRGGTFNDVPVANGYVHMRNSLLADGYYARPAQRKRIKDAEYELAPKKERKKPEKRKADGEPPKPRAKRTKKGKGAAQEDAEGGEAEG